MKLSRNLTIIHKNNDPQAWSDLNKFLKERGFIVGDAALWRISDLRKVYGTKDYHLTEAETGKHFYSYADVITDKFNIGDIERSSVLHPDAFVWVHNTIDRTLSNMRIDEIKNSSFTFGKNFYYCSNYVIYSIRAVYWSDAATSYYVKVEYAPPFTAKKLEDIFQTKSVARLRQFLIKERLK